ncbi:P-loop containing nucleoside triphosphate hydrolase protein [Mycena vulgaris]|nr:P-loop containing nucleoside triphosphate hydrolase protein [Mycena vulgaris]
MIAIFVGIIAYAYFDPVSLPTSPQGQKSCKFFCQSAGARIHPRFSALPVAQVNQSINNCPLPSRIFHGRQRILDKMHEYFNQDHAQQHIFLLYGVGGGGKTQIARKFIQASSCFSDSFYIDASNRDTIDAGLKNIAVIKTGNTSQDALNWLKGNHDQWLLFFDNADDPEINLNPFLPQCDHGNIIITSRNPGLRGYAGSDARVSDMEETDAIKLLLTSAAQEVTPRNEEMAAEIVQELTCLPLAIIQAGAFITESGALNTYLELYKENRARLLTKKPAQAHDDYEWTVYTTWQISFDRLSELAQTLLQLCSFLHHQGISEKIFSKASAVGVIGISEQELQKPMELLSWYLGPTGDWDSLRFTEVTNQLRAYSLIDFDADTGLFSIHPLVHNWSQSTLTNEEVYHYSMAAIVAMSIRTIQEQDRQLASLWLLPHIDSLRKGLTYIPPYVNAPFGSIYSHAERHKETVELNIVLLEEERKSLGADHPNTLTTMGNLAQAYHELGRLNEAEDIEVIVLEKKRESLGEDHPHTLVAMGNLARTYHKLGQLNKAEKLEVFVLEKRKKILGKDHLLTLLSMENLGATYYQLGQLHEAEELDVVVLEKRREILGEDHPDTLVAMADLAETYRKLGQLNRAEELEVVVLKKQRGTLGEEHPDTLTAMGNLAQTHHELGRLNEAEEVEVVVLEKRREILWGGPSRHLGSSNKSGTYI